MKYRKKSEEVEAIRFDDTVSSIDAAKKFCFPYILEFEKRVTEASIGRIFGYSPNGVLNTQNPLSIITAGQYLTKPIDCRNFYRIEIQDAYHFEATYELIP